MTNPLQFVRHAATVMTGTALAQAISLLTAPLLARLYTPSDFGVYAAIVAAAAILSIFATLRYELAIVLPPDESTAANLAGGLLVWSLLFCTVLALVVILFPQAIQVLFGKAAMLAPAIPLLTLVMAWTQVYNLAANREREYRTIAGSAISQQAGAALVSVGLGTVAFPWNGLVVGRILGCLTACGYFAMRLSALTSHWSRQLDWWQCAKAASAYRQFPLFNVPYSVIGSLSREFIVLALTAFHLPSAAGLYGLARSVLTAPISFLSSSLSQVFYKEAAGSIGTPEFMRLTLAILRSLAAGGSPFFVFGWLWAPDVFEIVFGPQWREAGTYASALIPITFLSLFTSWPERVFEVRQKQHVSLSIQLAFDALSIGAVWVGLAYGAEPLIAVRLYVALQCGYHLVYLFAVFRLSRLTAVDYLRFVTFVGMIVTLTIGLQLPMCWIGAAKWLQFATSLAVATALAAIFLLANRRWARRSVDVAA